LSGRAVTPKTDGMKKIGLCLLGLYLVIDGLLGFGVGFGPLVFLLYLIAIVAGICIFIAALKEK
jgi:hypothetical protein